MQKSILESVIEKYYLNGLVESVKWGIKDKSLVINFIPHEIRSLIGTIKCSNFILDDNEIAIYNTSQLVKLIKILNKEISVSTYAERKTSLKLLLSDNQYDLEFYLADKNMIDRVPEVSEPTIYEVAFKIDHEFINKFKNAKKGLGPDTNKFTIEANQLIPNQAYIVVGDLHTHANKVKFSIPIESTIPLSIMPFQADVLNEILLANENCNEGKFEISQHGLIKLTFKENDIESTYFLVRLD
jgi:hypothetical protein